MDFRPAGKILVHTLVLSQRKIYVNENLLSSANENEETPSPTNENMGATSRDFNTPIPTIRIENTDGDDNESNMLSNDGENVFVIGLEQEFDWLINGDTVVEDLQTKLTKILVFFFCFNIKRNSQLQLN